MMSSSFSWLNPLHLPHLLFWLVEYVVFLVRGTCVAIGDFWVMYVRVGKVWQQPRGREPSFERGDLAMQLATSSPCGSTLNATDAVLHLNENFVDRSLWDGLSEANAAPSVVVTGISYGGIGFYTALHVLLCGANVHGVVRSSARAEEAQRMMQAAVDRQCKLHRDWRGRVGRVMLHVCDMADTSAVAQLADKLGSDPNIRVLVCNAGPMCTPLALSPQGLEEAFATHHVGHSLLTLRMLQRLWSGKRQVNGGGSSDRVRRNNGASAENGGAHQVLPRLRIIITSSAAAATADPTPNTTFRRWGSVSELSQYLSRFSSYGNAKMCELLFALALARFVRDNPTLSASCTVNVLHPGPIRSRVIPNSQLPMRWLLDGEMAALFRMTPIIASLFVTDLCLSRRHAQTSGHFFRMGEDQSEFYAKMIVSEQERRGWWRNSTLWPGIPGPRVALCRERQQWLWDNTLDFLDAKGLVTAKAFRP